MNFTLLITVLLTAITLLADGYYIGGGGLRSSQADRTKVLREGER